MRPLHGPGQSRTPDPANNRHSTKIATSTSMTMMTFVTIAGMAMPSIPITQMIKK